MLAPPSSLSCAAAMTPFDNSRRWRQRWLRRYRPACFPVPLVSCSGEPRRAERRSTERRSRARLSRLRSLRSVGLSGACRCGKERTGSVWVGAAADGAATVLLRSAAPARATSVTRSTQTRNYQMIVLLFALLSLPLQSVPTERSIGPAVSHDEEQQTVAAVRPDLIPPPAAH